MGAFLIFGYLYTPMAYKLLTLLLIIVFLTLALSIRDSRRKLWATNRNGRAFTIRGVILLGIIILFLVFSLLR
jgi:hypothetical protein